MRLWTHMAIQSWVSTALREVPTNVFTFRRCLIHLQEQLYPPLGLVNVGDGRHRQLEVGRREDAALAGFGGPEAGTRCPALAARQQPAERLLAKPVRLLSVDPHLQDLATRPMPKR